MMNSEPTAVEQVLLAAHERARAVAVEDADGDDRREPVQRVERRRLDVVAGISNAPVTACTNVVAWATPIAIHSGQPRSAGATWAPSAHAGHARS